MKDDVYIPHEAREDREGKTKRYIVCGGRDGVDKEFVFKELDRLYMWEFPISWYEDYHLPNVIIITGVARGVDSYAKQWARSRGAHDEEFEAEWGKYGKAAGPIRNKRMIDEGKPDAVIAFDGGRGTENMIKQADAAFIRIIDCSYGEDNDDDYENCT